jgi:hypothetical protein
LPLTLWLGTYNEPGQVGRIRIEVVGYPGGGEATVIASFQIAAHGDDWLVNTFDLVFTPVSAHIPSQHWVEMLLEPGSGLEMVQFLSLTLAPQRPLDIEGVSNGFQTTARSAKGGKRGKAGRVR